MRRRKSEAKEFFRWLGCVLTLCLFLPGCVRYYRVGFNGFLDPSYERSPFAEGSSFFVLQRENIRNPIFESEIKGKIEYLLQQKGYSIGTHESADYYISFDYSIGAGETYSDVRQEYIPPRTGTIQRKNSDQTTTTWYVTYPGYTQYVPYKFTLYTALLNIKVTDGRYMRGEKKEKIVWIGESSSAEENPDLREVINYLLTVSFRYLGKDTSRRILENVYEKDVTIMGLLE